DCVSSRKRQSISGNCSMETSQPAPDQQAEKKARFYYGWVIVAITAIAQCTQSAEIFPVLSVLIKPMTEEFGWSRTTFTLATSIGTLAGGFLGPIIGPMVDKHGSKWILFVAFTLLGITMIWMAFIDSLW